MADIETTVTLDEVTDAIAAVLEEALGPAVESVSAYAEDGDGNQRRAKIATPAVVIELDSIDPGQDPGTDQSALRCRWVARAMVSGLSPAAARAVRSLAASVAHAVRLQTWGLPVEPAQFLGAFPDDFRPELPDIEVWRVEWEQDIHVGTSVWSPDPAAVVPSEVYIGYPPEIGEGHEDDYELLTEPDE